MALVYRSLPSALNFSERAMLSTDAAPWGIHKSADSNPLIFKILNPLTNNFLPIPLPRYSGLIYNARISPSPAVTNPNGSVSSAR